jgi:hypothetical protein
VARPFCLFVCVRGVNAKPVSIDELDDKDTLRSAAKLLDSENRRLMREVLQLKRKIEVLEGKDPASLQQVLNLEHQIEVRNKMLFGDKSEKRSASDETVASASPAEPRCA